MNEQINKVGSFFIRPSIRSFPADMRLTLALKATCRLIALLPLTTWPSSLISFLMSYSVFEKPLALGFLPELFSSPTPVHEKKYFFLASWLRFPVLESAGAHVRKGDCINWLLEERI